MPFPLKQPEVQIGSRSNFEETPHITTRRSISEWKLIQSDEESVENSLVGSQQIMNPQIANKYNPLNGSQINNTDDTPSNLFLNKRTASSSKNELLGDTQRGKDIPANYQGDSCLTNDECTNSKERSDYDVNVNEELIEYEPRPPSVKTNQIEESRNVQTYDSVIPALESSHPQIAPEIFNVPFHRVAQLESANQFLEEPKNALNDNAETATKFFDDETSRLPSNQLQDKYTKEPQRDNLNEGDNYAETVLSLSAPSTIMNSSEEDELIQSDKAVTKPPTKTINKNIISQENHPSKSLVGTDFNERGITAGSKPSQSLTVNRIESPLSTDNNTEEGLMLSESKLNFINASQFTLILKNLERKVENIADLVKKTCGKGSIDGESDERQPEAEFTDYEKRLLPNPNPVYTEGDSRSTKPIKLPTTLGNPAEAEKAIVDIRPTTRSPLTSQALNTNSKSVDDEITRLNQDAGVLVNKVMDIARTLQGQKISQAPSGTTAEVVGCSKEDSSEYVGESRKDSTTQSPRRIDKLTSNQRPETVETRSNFQQSVIPTTPSVSITSDEAVACSKEDSQEYVGESNTPTERQLFRSLEGTQDLKNANEEVRCSKESNEYVGNRAQESTKEPEYMSTSGIRLEKVSEKPTRDGNTQSIAERLSDTNGQFTKENIEQGVLNNNEEVGCSKGESEEYIGKQKPTDTIESTTQKQKETVGCSKEEDEYIPTYPVYNSYRTAEDNLRKSKPPMLTTNSALDDVLHQTPPLEKGIKSKPPSASTLFSNPNTQPINGQSVPTKTDLSTAEPIRGDQSTKDLNEETIPEEISNSVQRFGHHPKKESISKVLQEQTIPQPAAANRQYQPMHHYTPINDGTSFLPSSEPIQQYSSRMPQPPLTQRFSDRILKETEQPTSKNSLPITQDLTRLPTRNDIVGVTSNLISNDNAEPSASIEVHTQPSYTLNPFSIFGRVVPQLNNTEISFHQFPHGKIYFDGTGMQLPLNMKKHQDGSYQLSVDIDKLCNNCNGNRCTNKEVNNIDDIEKHTTVENEKDSIKIAGDIVGMQSSRPQEEEDQNESLESDQKTETEGKNDTKSSNQKISNKDDEHDVDKRKVKGSFVETSVLQDNLKRRKLLNRHNIQQRNYNKRIAKEKPLDNSKQEKLLDNFKQDKPIHQRIQKRINRYPLFGLTPKSDVKKSEISKRSPSLSLLFPNLQYYTDHENKPSNGLNEDEVENGHTPSNSLHSLDESLKKIDTNMKKYYDRRSRLDNYYKNQNKKELEEPDRNKDIVKRRVTLVNNVLSWMKDIALQNAHT